MAICSGHIRRRRPTLATGGGVSEDRKAVRVFGRCLPPARVLHARTRQAGRSSSKVLDLFTRYGAGEEAVETRAFPNWGTHIRRWRRPVNTRFPLQTTQSHFSRAINNTPRTGGATHSFSPGRWKKTRRPGSLSTNRSLEKDSPARTIRPCSEVSTNRWTFLLRREHVRGPSRENG